MDGSNDIERPLNSLSSPLDLVAVYGASDTRNIALRGTSGGSFLETLETSGDNLLPLNNGRFVNGPDTSNRFFLAGDHRANEHAVLTAFHTLFVREHNRLVSLIRNRVGNLPRVEIYEAARAMNITQFQKIVFEQLYPAAVRRPLPPYTGFRRDVDPTVSDIFSGAAFRVGHTMVSNIVPRLNAAGNRLSPIPMARLFFREASTFTSELMDEILRGTAHELAEEVDTWVVNALRNQLFQNVDGEEGFDLVALNIQRGRDHALPSFNEIRDLFGIPRATSFADITTDASVVGRLSRAYRGNVNNVEAFVGLLAEDHEPGSTFGKTMIAVWEAEFTRLRDGDQFLYLRTERFPNLVRAQFSEWIEKIQSTNGVTLANVIADNTRITSSQLPQTDVFKVEESSASEPRSIRIFVRSLRRDD